MRGHRMQVTDGNGYQARRARAIAALVSTSSAMVLAAPAMAQTPANVRSFDIPAQSLPDALILFGRQAGIEVTAESVNTRGRSTTGVSGRLSPSEALSRLLSGTGLTFRWTSGRAVVIEPAPKAVEGAIQLGPVRVEGAGGMDGKGGALARFGNLPPERPGFKADYQATATKTPLTIRETPLTIVVTTRESIEARYAATLESAIELTPGVTYTNVPNPGEFGGQGLRHFGNSIALRDQLLTADRDIRTDGFSTGNASVIDMAAYERIEVLKGPSGFYGQGSLGGFINQVRRKPQQEFAASVGAQVGSFDSYRAESDATGAITADGALRGRLTAAYTNSGSYVEQVEDERIFVAPSLEAVIGERTRVLLQLLYQDESFVPNPGIPLFLINDRQVAPKISRRLLVGTPSATKSTAETFEAMVRVDHEISDTWLATLLVHHNKIKRRGSFGNYAYSMSAAGDVYLYTQKAEVDQHRWAGELRLDGRFNAFGNEHNLTFGIERNRRDAARRQGYTYVGSANIYAENFSDSPIDGVISPFRTDRRAITTNTALFGQLVLNLSERTKLLVGGRYDWSKQKATGFYQGIPEIGGAYDGGKFTVRTGLSHTFTDNVTAYVSYGQSFNPVANLARSGSILPPETGNGYEAGLKTEWFDKALAVNLSAYHVELDNRPLRDPNNGPGEGFFISTGLHRSKGIELEVSGSPVAGLTIGAAANLSTNRFVDRDDPLYGLAFHGSIDAQHSLYLNYEVQTGALRGLGIGGTWVHVGEREYVTGTRQTYADGYDRIDLNLSYKGFEGFDIGLNVRNLFDKRYLETAGYPGSGNYFGSPRAVQLRLKAGF